MRPLIPVLFLFFWICCAPLSHAQQFSMRVIEFHGEFLGNAKVMQGSTAQKISQFGFGASSSFGTNGIGGILEYDYRRINLKNLGIPDLKPLNSHEFYFGIRYLPMRPTLIIGQTGLRLTLGAMLGFDLEPNVRTCLFGGVSISPIRSVSGILVNVAYRPGVKPINGYAVTPCWMLRFGFLIGPTAE